MAWFMMATGLAVLTAGAELVVRGASRVAIAMKISPLIVGLTIVAFGTSAPELVVSLESALKGNADVALGNVLGSNILNILLILGLSALVVPLIVKQQLIRLDVPLMVFVSGLVGVMALDGAIGRWDGVVLVGGLIAWNVCLVRLSRSQRRELDSEFEREFGGVPATEQKGPRMLLNIGLVIVGLVLLVAGARVFVDNAVMIARALQVPELIIGLTLVAAGTSLPEVATSLVAAVKGERDIAVGNVVGSNLFNLLCVLGLTSVVTNGIPVSRAVLTFDIPVMIGVAAACLPVFLTGERIERWEGGAFLSLYVLYTIALVLSAIKSPLFGPLIAFVVGVAIPGLLLAVLIQHFRYRKRSAGTTST